MVKEFLVTPDGRAGVGQIAGYILLIEVIIEKLCGDILVIL